MAQSHALLRATTEIGIDVADVLKRVNELLLEMNAGDLFVTVIYGILNRSSGEFRYARAGHELPLVLDENRSISVPPMQTGLPLGMFKDLILDVQTVTIPPGGGLVLCSDGPADTRNLDGVRFGNDGLYKKIEELQGGNSAQQSCQAVYDCLVEYQNGAPQFDDVTLLAVHRI
jgi:phosphoserine phosphatase RsbU/P